MSEQQHQPRVSIEALVAPRHPRSIVNRNKLGRVTYSTEVCENGRVCTSCNKFLLWKFFHRLSSHSTGHACQCKYCRNSGRKSRAKFTRAVSKELGTLPRNHPEYSSDYMYKWRFGISLEGVRKILLGQGGCCACCSRELSEKKMHLDHCHITGMVRGVLCNPCNTGMGKLGDTSDSVMNAVNYLRKFEENNDN